MRVLVTNADYANALAAVRSLGRRGIEVVCGSQRKRAQSFYSIYCTKRLVYPSPSDEAAFLDTVVQKARSERIEAVLPVGYAENVVMSRHADELSKVTKVPVAPWESMKVASDKRLSMKLAQKLGVGVPRMYDSPEEIDRFPVVIKDVGGSGSVRYVTSKEQMAGIRVSGALIQDYVPGEGYGFFALFNKGDIRAFFMHRRLREYPVTGGASTAAESVFDPELKDQGVRLLTSLKWHGVAMAEFKKDSRDGKFKLMEINPKFWGSLDLSVAAGVDFPWLAAKMAIEGDVEPVMEYKTGVRYRWLLPYDVLHVLARPASAKDFLEDFCDPRVGTNIWRRDIGPNVFQAAMTVGMIATRLNREKLRHPHGSPRGGP